MNSLIEFKNVTKKYGKITIINNASFGINEHAICGLVGPNGAGKTTMIKLLLDITPATEGTINVMGTIDAKERALQQQSIGAIVDGPAYYRNLNAYQNMKVVAHMKNFMLSDAENERLLRLVGLGNAARKKVKKFSTGMKQRLAIALSLIGDPKLLIWDEPINGLDPEGILEVRKLIHHLRDTLKVTFLISSHLLNELDKVADQIILIKDGRIRFNDTFEAMLSRSGKETLEEAYMQLISGGGEL